jgi:hypothetical protein
MRSVPTRTPLNVLDDAPNSHRQRLGPDFNAGISLPYDEPREPARATLGVDEPSEHADHTAPR